MSEYLDVVPLLLICQSLVPEGLFKLSLLVLQKLNLGSELHVLQALVDVVGSRGLGGLLQELLLEPQSGAKLLEVGVAFAAVGGKNGQGVRGRKVSDALFTDYSVVIEVSEALHLEILHHSQVACSLGSIWLRLVVLLLLFRYLLSLRASA